MAQSQETIQRLAELRQLSRENKLTMEQMREAITLLRNDRVEAHATSAKAKATKSAAKEKPNTNATDLLSELDGL